jgi:Bacterial membrane protein YfhO
MLDDAIAYRRDAGISAFVLAVILCLVFAPFLFGNQSLLNSAAEAPSLYAEGAKTARPVSPTRVLDAGAPAWITEPAAAITHRLYFERHRAPFWNADDGYGKPYAAALEPAPFHPFTAALSIAPSPRTYAWFVVARLFFAGLFAALFIRLFCRDRWGAIGGGIATMLTGYYILYYGMPHLSVDVGFPMLLWATELVVRRGSPARIATLGVAAGLLYLGGGAESALLAIAAGLVYALVRIFSVGRSPLKTIGALFAGHILGVSLGAVVLLPFAELVPLAFTSHDPSSMRGLGFDGNWRFGFLTELFPHVIGLPFNSIMLGGAGWTGIRGFVGCAAFTLAVLALLVAMRKRDARTPIIGILALIAAYAIFKRFGNPIVNWSGALPGFRQIDFAKYIEFITGDTIGILAGFGVVYLREGVAGTRTIVSAFAVTLSLVSYLFLQTHSLAPPEPLGRTYSYAIVVGLLALLGLLGSAIAASRTAPWLRRVGSAAIIALLVAEPFAGYMYRGTWLPVAITDNPYGGAPYVTYLQQHVASTNERVLGVKGDLFPNWPGAYGLNDPVSLGGVFLQNYFPFIDAFLRPEPPPTADDLVDRFTGTRPVNTATPLFRRWLALSSIGYYIEPAPEEMLKGPPGEILHTIWDQVLPRIPAGDHGVTLTAIQLDGVIERVFFEHPVHDFGVYLQVPRDRPMITADIGLSPLTYQGPSVCGGPVTFKMVAYNGIKVIASLTRTIDPKHNVTQRHWIPMSLDLHSVAGRTTNVHLSTQAVDLCTAWAVWGEPRFVAKVVKLKHSSVMYPVVFNSPGAVVYRIPNSLARLTLYHHVQQVSSFKAAIAAMTVPAFDVYHDVVLDGPPPPLGAAAQNDRVTVTRMEDDLVDAQVTATSDALLMQNDSFYPGWQATVDGRNVPIEVADGIFRGIPIPAGNHVVQIAYRSRVVTMGSWISLIALLLIITAFGYSAFAARRAGTTSLPE